MLCSYGLDDDTYAGTATKKAEAIDHSVKKSCTETSQKVKHASGTIHASDEGMSTGLTEELSKRW